MRKTAGFLKACTTLVLVFEVLGAVILAGLEIFLAVAGSFSDLAAKTGEAITIQGGEMTPAEMDALKPILMAALGIALVSLVFTIIGTAKTRKALAECKEERPFSEECVTSIRSAARSELIGGIVGILGSIVLAIMARNLTVNGRSVANTSFSFNLSFLIEAAQTYLFYHVARYGQTLENR